MEWMRCNSCWLKVEKKPSMFCLTQCGHVYCNKCIVKAEEKCFQCGSMGNISLSLKEPFNPQIAHYFTRINDLLEKITQAQLFQESQMSLCLQRTDANEKKYQSLKEAYWVSAENLKKVYQKYNKLKVAVNTMQKENKSIMIPSICNLSQCQSTPGSIRTTRVSQNSQYSNPCFAQKHPSNMSNSGVFRVPSSTKVPRSAGYYTSSTNFSRGSTNNS